MKTCMATVSLGGTLEEKIDGIATAGFDGLELLCTDVHASALSPRDIADRCATLGLKIDLYQPFRRAEGVTPTEFPDVLTRFHRELDVMEALGATSILVVSNTDSDADSSRDLSATQVAALGSAAGEHGVTVMFEALAWGTHINRVAHVRDVLARADHSNVLLAVDTFHLVAGGEGVEAVADLEPGSVGLLQIADAPWMPLDLLTWSRNYRCFPGAGEFDLVTPVASVLNSGYSGPVSLEIFNPGYRERPAADVARHGAESLRRLLADVDTLATSTLPA